MMLATLALLLVLAATPARADGVRFEVWPAHAHVWKVTARGDQDLGLASAIRFVPDGTPCEIAVKAPGYAAQYWSPTELRPVQHVVLSPVSPAACLTWWLHFHPWLAMAALALLLLPLGARELTRYRHGRKVQALSADVPAEEPWQGRRLGRYALGRRLGIGARSMVYYALPVQPGPPCAMKILRPDQNLRRFQREIRICRMLVHPNIVRLLDSGEQQGVAWLALELVSGQTLSDLIKEKPLDLHAFKTIFPQILDAVAYAHRRGVVHRDLKPDNVLVNDKGHARVLDFGVAQLAEGTRLTHAGALVGTLIYMAPEQLREEKASETTDQFALGVMGREMLTGEIPFLELGPDALYARRIMGTEPPPLEGFPEELARVIERMMASRPSDRFPTLEEAQQALLAALSKLEA
ncbi:MAG: serine/threonine-protein kinase [Candidatus Xenobia bacterium]